MPHGSPTSRAYVLRHVEHDGAQALTLPGIVDGYQAEHTADTLLELDVDPALS